MSLVMQKIANLLNGVSQRPEEQRLPSQVREQVNAISSQARGVMKRPGSRHLGKLSSDTTGWQDAFIHTVNRDENERYHVVVVGGTIKAFDAVTLEEIEIVKPEGTNYLQDDLGAGFRAVTIGDTTIITNRGVKTAATTKKADAATIEALAFIRQSDFSTTYSLTLDGVTVSLRTVDQDDPSSRIAISTEAIATDLLALLTDEDTLAAKFTFTQIGSTIHIIRQDAGDFTISSQDGLGDKGLGVVKDKVQSFSDLPARAPNGFRVQVVGDVTTNKDNFFVKFDDLGLPETNGVWRECPEPGSLIELDDATMPHRLTLRGSVVGAKTGGTKTLIHEGMPSLVAHCIPIGAEAGITNASWDTLLPSGNAVVPGTTIQLRRHAEGVRKTVTNPAEEVRVQYDMLIPALGAGIGVYVRLYKNGVQVDERFHAAGPRGSRFFGEFNFETKEGTFRVQDLHPLAVDDVLELKLAYSIPDGMGLPDLVTLTLYPDSLSLTDFVAKRFVMDGALYPDGSTITLTLGGTDFTFTADGDATADEAGAALAALIDADPDYSIIPGSGPDSTFDVRRVDGADFTVTIASSFSALTFHNSALNMTPDEFVGLILKNTTDGSTGTVTANTETTITVSSLSGGGSNTFTRGDVCKLILFEETPGVFQTYLVFEPIPWKERGAGSLDVVPFPSCLGETISDVFFYQNRLGFLSQENVILSSAGDLYNFFRYTATDLRADDMIDVRSAHAEVTIFDSAFLWAGGLYIKANNMWFQASGDPALTPTTIRLDPVGKYLSSRDPRPVVMASQVFFTRGKSSNTQVFELSMRDDGKTTQAPDITKDIPTYIEGAPLAMAGDAAEGFLALLTNGNNQQFLYVYSYLIQGADRILSSWSRWEFAPGCTIIALSMADGVLAIVRKQSDGIYVEQIDLDLSPVEVEKVSHLDRRVDSESTPSGVFLAGEPAVYDEESDTTTWTLPYSVPTNGSQGAVSVCNRDTKEIYTVTRPSATTVAVTGQGDLTLAPVTIGQPFQFKVELSTLFVRNRDGQPEVSGRLQIRYIDIGYAHTTDLAVEVAPVGRSAVTSLLNAAEPKDGKLHIPVLCQNTQVDITLTNDTPGPCAFISVDMEGWFTTRGRRI